MSFVTLICCPYRDSPYKQELGDRMTKFPRLSRAASFVESFTSFMSTPNLTAGGKAVFFLPAALFH
jgi:hypothetical protein